MSQNLVLEMPKPKKRAFPKLPKLPKIPCRILPFLALLILLGCALIWFWLGRVEGEAVLEGQILPISSAMTARVTEVLANDGQTVRAGQPLLRLDGSGYRQQEADARALVRGAYIPTMEETAERVAAAQAAEEYTVRRVALARHEEEVQRRLLEQRAQEHARAQLRMRDMDARGVALNSKQRQDAQYAEGQARQQWEAARAAQEAASRSRAAIDGELRRARADVERARAAGAMPSPSRGTAVLAGPSDPTLVIAPQDGRLMGKLPPPGTLLARGETVATLVPGSNAGLWVVASLPAKDALRARPGQLSFVLPQGMDGVALLAEVEDMTAGNSPNQERLPVRLRLLDERIPSFSGSLQGRPAKVVIWSNALPGMRMVAPLLALF